MSIISNIQKRCATEGVSVSKVCKAANVDPSTISRYKKNPPKSIKVVEAIENELDKIERKRLGLVKCANCGEISSNSRDNCPQCRRELK